MNIRIASAFAPSPTLPRKREREYTSFFLSLPCKEGREYASFFLPLSRLRGRESREARRVGASALCEEKSETPC
ncbi:hypothetical protein BH10PSE10_BH10PSE10_15060 [soil metagenome]